MMLAAVLLIVSVPFGIQIALTPPTPPTPKEKRVSNDYPLVGSLGLSMYKLCCWIHCMVEILVLVLPAVARQFPRSPTIRWVTDISNEIFLPSSIGKDTSISFPPLRIIGALLVISGGTLRYLCFRELGQHFTFHLTLLEKHALVTTGPYSIVRHPAYCGTILFTVGSILWHATSGSWLLQSGVYTHMVAWIVLIPAVIIEIGMGAVVVVFRPKKEDEMLKKEFGKQWDEWARKVPYKLFPGIY